MRWIDELKRVLRRIAGEKPHAPPSEELSCHEALRHVFEWLDGELPPEEAGPVGTHLETCARCYPHLVFERAFAEAVSRAAKAEATPAQLRGRVLESLCAAGFEQS